MKDIEKIKSEDLGCQVQDANPGNFAIEQEVGAMVGATVPAPTAPSADDARELGAQLLVFLRRALLPIRSALRTALADIYAHLDSRCTDYTPAAYAPYSATRRAYDPMGTLPARSVANLLTAITAFAPRKISNGSAPNDGIKDGISLAHLLCSTDAANSVIEICDDNTVWVMNKAFTGYPNLKKLTILGKGELTNRWFANMSSLEELIAPNIQSYSYGYAGSDDTTMPAGVSNLASLKKLDLRGLGDAWVYGNGNQYGAVVCGCPALTEVYFGKVRGTNTYESWGQTKFYIQYCTALEKLSVENMAERNCLVRSGQNENLIYLQIRGIQANSCNLSWWNPTDKTTTFLQNFLEHICKKLANRTGQTKLTLTLSAGVYTAIMTDKYIKAELVARNWKVTDGSNNYNN